MAMRALFPLVLPVLVAAGCMSTLTVHGRIEIGGGNLTPLPIEKQGLVRASEADASRTVLEHVRSTGWPDVTVAWQDGHCALVAWYETYPMSRAPKPPPPYPVYLVELVSGAARGWIMVDARSGELGAYIGDHPELSCQRAT